MWLCEFGVCAGDSVKGTGVSFMHIAAESYNLNPKCYLDDFLHLRSLPTFFY